MQVQDLLLNNSVIAEDRKNQDKGWYRFFLLGGTHTRRLKTVEDVSTRDRKIAYIAQLSFSTLHHVLLVWGNLKAGTGLGANYLAVVKVGCGIGLIVGVVNGWQQNSCYLSKSIQEQADVYASYRNRFKILQPIQEILNLSLSLLCRAVAFNVSSKFVLLDAFTISSGLTYSISSIASGSVRRVVMPLAHQSFTKIQLLAVRFYGFINNEAT